MYRKRHTPSSEWIHYFFIKTLFFDFIVLRKLKKKHIYTYKNMYK